MQVRGSEIVKSKVAIVLMDKIISDRLDDKLSQDQAAGLACTIAPNNVRILLRSYTPTLHPPRSALPQFIIIDRHLSLALTPIEKNRVNPRDPKYASENGRRSFEAMCFRSIGGYGSQVVSDAVFDHGRVRGRSGKSLQFRGPVRTAKDAMNSNDPSVNDSTNFRGFRATIDGSPRISLR